MPILTLIIFIGITALVTGFLTLQIVGAFKTLNQETLHGKQQAKHQNNLQPNAGDTIHNQFLLGLAIEVDEFRHKEEATTNKAEKAQFRQSMNDVSIEVVDTVLAMNGFDPHAGEIYGAEEEMPDKVLYFGDYTNPEKY